MLKGIDVSYANGTIQWDKVKSSGIDFAVIRSSFGSYSSDQIDTQFYNNADGCIKNNIPFGIYHFAYFTSEEKAVEEAKFAVRMANIYKNYVKFIVLDIEDDTERYARQQGAYPNWKICVIAFLGEVRKAGYEPVLYVNQNWLINKLNYDTVKKYKLWYAAIDVNTPKYSPSLWQYSWKGHISGINGDVDMNHCYDETLFNNKTPTVVNNKALFQLTSSKAVDYIVKITANDGVNVRIGAGVNYKILGAIPYSEIVRISRQTSGNGYKWGLATFGNLQGWIALDFTQTVKAIDELAKEVISGKWGNGDDRKKNLTAAGYDYNEVQKMVNKILLSEG